MMVAGLDPRQVEVRVDLAEVGQVLIQHFQSVYSVRWIAGGQATGQFDGMLTDLTVEPMRIFLMFDRRHGLNVWPSTFCEIR